MPIKTQGDLPVKEILERENIFVMDEKRAMHQDIRPIQILILNLMPLKEETELQLLRSLSNTPLQVDVTFMAVESHEAKNTSLSHLNKFYETFTDIKKRKFDGMIITGAPVEQMPFEEVDYWNELTEIMDWTEKHVTSTIFLCWAAQASLYHFYGLEKKPLDKKMFGLFQHRVLNRKIPLVRGFDVYAALSMDRPYRKALENDEVLRLMIDEIKNFDMQVFLAFQRVIHKGGNYGIKKETGYRNEGHFTEGNGNP